MEDGKTILKIASGEKELIVLQRRFLILLDLQATHLGESPLKEA